MASELALAEKQNALAKPLPEFSSEQIRLLAETVAKGCDQNELAFFLQVAKLKRLDPFTGQIHVVKRWDSSLGREKMTVQVGVDGYRAIASRTNDLAGIDDPEYDTDVEEHPKWAKITVYRYGRDNEKVPYKATARWGEYVQTYKDKQTGELKPNPMWKRMPYLMLGKVAEALALRKAFPDELSGMYTNEEMGQADNDGGTTPASVTKPPVNMPKSIDEKKPPAQAQQPAKAAPPQAQATSTANPPAANAPAELEELSGEIISVTPGKNGVLVLNVKGLVVVIPGRLATDDLMVGAKVLMSVAKVTIKGKHMFEAREIKMVDLPDDTIEGEIVESEKPDFAEECRKDGLDGLFDEQPRKAQTKTEPEPAAETAKPGTIGIKRGKRLHAIITQSHKNTGFTEDECHKIMSALPVPIEHFRDIEMGMYAQFEKWANGEEDFNDFWKD